MDINKIFQSKWFKGAIIGIAALICILLIFKAGMIVGGRKADFSCKWSDNYHQNFGGPREGFLKGFGDREFMDAHGIAGQIIKIDGPAIIIKDRDNTEKIILTNEKTVINRFKDTIKVTDLKIDDNIVVIGSPNDSGQIEAKLIRVMPFGEPPAQPMPGADSNVNAIPPAVPPVNSQ